MKPTLVVMEGPALNAKGQGVHQLAGLWWLVKHDLWLRGIPVATPTPWDVKQIATGKRGAKKDDVLREMAQRYAGFSGGNDEADALALAMLGATYLRHRRGALFEGLPKLPLTHLAAVDSVSWPTLPDGQRQPLVVGLDVSITCTGVATIHHDRFYTGKIETKPSRLRIKEMGTDERDNYVHGRVAQIVSRIGEYTGTLAEPGQRLGG